MFGPCVKNTLVAPYVARAGMACLIAVGLALTACGSNPDRDRPDNPLKERPEPGGPKAPLSDAELHVAADKLYRQAHSSVEDSDWTQARDRLNKLIARYPFSDYATQAEMEKIYVGYKGGQPDEALADADRFLRAHPRSAQAEYVQYLKGLINFERNSSLSEAIGLETSPRKDVSNERRSFDDFALLVQRYPNSKFCGDARRRMIFLRNRIASHDLTVAQYYLRRGAYIAAARRAQSVIAEYPGAPATAQALAILEKSYRQAGLTEQADDAAQIIAANLNNKPFTTPRPTTVSQVVADPAPAAYPAAPAAASTTVAAPAAISTETKPTLMQRFTHLFDIFDTTKPENQHVLIVGGHGDTGSSVPATPTPATAPSSTTSSGTATPPANPTPDAAKSSGFKLVAHEPGTDDDAPAATTAPPPNKP